MEKRKLFVRFMKNEKKKKKKGYILNFIRLKWKIIKTNLKFKTISVRLKSNLHGNCPHTTLMVLKKKMLNV